MIRDLEGKSAKELREIVLIQIEEYQKLQSENVKLKSTELVHVVAIGDKHYSLDDIRDLVEENAKLKQERDAFSRSHNEQARLLEFYANDYQAKKQCSQAEGQDE